MSSLTLIACKKALLPRTREAHKGLFGHVLVIGGDYGMGGAVRLCGEAALRTGAGLVSVATRREHAYAITGVCPELMCHGVQEGDIESILIPLFKKATVVVLGVGLGQAVWGQHLFQCVLKHWNGDLILDGDGLNLLAKQKVVRQNWILTPHPGEASRLLGESIDFIQQNRLDALQQLQKQYQGVMVLKGADTLILGQSGAVAECVAGYAAMATAGMGDVLAGMIAGLVAQKVSPESAAQLGVCAHVAAAKLASIDGQERGLVATDLFRTIVQCLN